MQILNYNNHNAEELAKKMIACKPEFVEAGCKDMDLVERAKFTIERWTKNNTKANKDPEKRKILKPLYTALAYMGDSGAALRALEIGADALLKGTRVDGVYTADPEKDPNAVKYEELSFDKAIEDRLKVMDQTAFALCREGNMPIIVFDMNQKGNLTKLVKGEKVGTLVHV
jgi:uridylate kinase